MVQRYVGGVGRLDDILHHLESQLGPLSGEPVALEGGITNRNFRVTLGDVEYVVRVHGRATALLGIDREAERLASETAAHLGIAPEVAAGRDDCLVTRFVACRAASSPDVAARVEEIARALRSFHESDVELPGTFWVPDLLEEYARIVQQRGAELPAAYGEATAAAGQIAAVMPMARPRPCHNDLLAGNIILAQEGTGMLIVDWEYAGMGHPYFDLGNLSVNNAFDDADDDRLLSAYHEEDATDGRRAALKLMRVLSDAREAAWGVVQEVVSELEFDFERYGREHFERLHDAVSGPHFREWLAAVGEAEHGDGQSA
jgi:thiamine kinase-like enzyme